MERFGGHKSKTVERPRSEEDLEKQIGSEVTKLERNSEIVKNDLSHDRKLDAKEGDGSIERLASNVRKIIIGATALVAIPLVASMVSPELMGQIGELNQMAKEFVNDHAVEVLGAAVALVAVGIGPGIIQGIRDQKQHKYQSVEDMINKKHL